MTKKILIYLAVFFATSFFYSLAEGFRAPVWKAEGTDFKKYKTYAWAAPW